MVSLKTKITRTFRRAMFCGLVLFGYVIGANHTAYLQREIVDRDAVIADYAEKDQVFQAAMVVAERAVR